MFSRKLFIMLALLVLSSSLVLDAYAIWSPTRSEVNLAGLKLFGSSDLLNPGAYQIDSTSMTSQLMNNSSIDNSIANTSLANNLSINNSWVNNSLINASLINISSKNTSSINAEPAGSSKPAIVAVDLSSYARNRLNKNLTGYRNIPYPMTGSRGFTSSAAGGGGCCGGG
jgi:hypothetical protein